MTVAEISHCLMLAHAVLQVNRPHWDRWDVAISHPGHYEWWWNACKEIHCYMVQGELHYQAYTHNLRMLSGIRMRRNGYLEVYDTYFGNKIIYGHSKTPLGNVLFRIIKRHMVFKARNKPVLWKPNYRLPKGGLYGPLHTLTTWPNSTH